MKKRLLSLIMLIGITFTSCASTVAKSSEKKIEKTGENLAKNVIMIIPDGMSVDVLTLARWYNGGEPMAVDPLASGLVRTYSSDAAIADSAPAGTAMATGHKSHTGYVGVLPDENNMPGLEPLKKGDEKKPVASVLEGAKLQGKSTGIIATSEIMHATPGDFTAHVPDRKDYDSISEQQVHQNLDVVIGGGTKFFTKEERKDKEDLLKTIKEDYQFVDNKADFEKIKSGNLFAMFADADLPYDMDRDEKAQPSLAEMTNKAIELLSKNKEGFFLMVEASKIDWAAHANDPIGLISDALAFDDTVKVALDFAKKDKETVIISATDHGNSGMTIGNMNTNDNYDKIHISEYIDPLLKANLTGEGVEKLLNGDRTNIEEIMSKHYGIDDLSEEEIDKIKEAETGSLNYTVGPMIAERANIGFTTNGHTGEDIPLYVYAPEKIERLTGTVENTDLAKYTAKVFGFDLGEVSDILFVKDDAFEEKGGKIKINDSDKENLVLEVTKGKKKIELPENKNIAIVDGKEVKITGVVVYNGIDFYVPQEAIDLLD